MHCVMAMANVMIIWERVYGYVCARVCVCVCMRARMGMDDSRVGRTDANIFR